VSAPAEIPVRKPVGMYTRSRHFVYEEADPCRRTLNARHRGHWPEKSGSDRRDIRRDLDETVEWWIEKSVHLLKYPGRSVRPVGRRRPWPRRVARSGSGLPPRRQGDRHHEISSTCRPEASSA